jgi:hypothetical protein
MREDCKVSCEIGASQRGLKPYNTKAEEYTKLRTITRRQPVKIQQTEKSVHAAVNC